MYVYVCVWMCVYMYVYMSAFVCMHVWMDVCISACVSMCMCVVKLCICVYVTCVCMHACVCVYACICMCVYVCVWMCVYMHVYIPACVCMHAGMYVCKSSCVCVCVCVWMCVYAGMCVCLSVSKYAYVWVCMNVYTYVCIYASICIMHACMFVRISSHVVYVCCEGVYICMCHMYVYMCACLHMYRVCVSAYVLCVHVCVPTHVCVCVNVCVHMHMSAHGMHACMCVCLPAYVCECVCVYVFVYVSVWCLLILLEKFPINLNFYLFFSTILNLFSVPCNLKETDPVHCLKVTNLRGGHPYYRWPTSFGGRLSWLKTPPPPLVHQGPRVSARVGSQVLVGGEGSVPSWWQDWSLGKQRAACKHEDVGRRCKDFPEHRGRWGCDFGRWKLETWGTRNVCFQPSQWVGRGWIGMPGQSGSPPGVPNMPDHRPLACIVIIWPIW